MIETGEELRAAREKLGWTEFKLGLALGLSGGHTKRGTRVLEMERGVRPVSGPVATLVQAFLDGWRPKAWEED